MRLELIRTMTVNPYVVPVNRTPKLRSLGSLRWRSGAGYFQRYAYLNRPLLATHQSPKKFPLCQLLAESTRRPEGVHGRRGSDSGRAVYDDPRVAVGALVLAESAALAQAETK
jgi:hypothetical protein